MRWKTHQPYPHQLESAQRAFDIGHYAFLFEMGAGKTFATIITLRKLFTREQRLMRTVIFAPLVTLYNWKDEFEMHSFIDPKSIHIIDKTGKQRLKLLERAVQYDNILIMNWEAIQNPDVFDRLMDYNPEVLVGDELHLIKNYRAKRAKAAVKLADHTRKNRGHVYGLTGTAILNSIEDVFMQYRFLDGGELFGKNFFTFRGVYLQDKNAGWSSRPGYFPKWEPRTDKFDELHSRIYRIATRVTKDECIKDLPPLVRTKRNVQLSPEQRRMYNEMKDEFITFIKEKEAEGVPRAAVANLAVTKALRLLQITTGFVTDEEGTEYEIKKNPRLDATETLLAELTPDHKVILWCSFKKNYEMLGKLCDKLKLKHTFIYGGQSAKERRDSIKSFQEDDKTRVVIANRRAGGIGVNLTAASYSIVFSRNFSLGEEKQSEARNHRGGSQIHNKIVKIDLVAKETIDELILAALENKQKISDCIIDWSKDGI